VPHFAQKTWVSSSGLPQFLQKPAILPPGVSPLGLRFLLPCIVPEGASAGKLGVPPRFVALRCWKPWMQVASSDLFRIGRFKGEEADGRFRM